MTKVTIVTPHAVYNYGACLQSYALYTYIKSIGFEPLMYDFEPHKDRKKLSKKEKIFVALKNICKMIHKKEINNGNKLFEEFINQYAKTTSKTSDVFIVGSDQVWNPLNLEGVFELAFADEKAYKASYAASIGVSNIPHKYEEIFSKAFLRLKHLSAREEATAREVERISGRNCRVDIDPVFLLPKETWKKIENKVDTPAKYILIYLLHIPKNINTIIKKAKEKYGSDVVLVDRDGVLRYGIKNTKSFANIGPREFLWLIDHSEYVITTSFHGTAFSIIFEKQFNSIINPASPSRITNLLKICGIKNNQIIDYDTVNNNLKKTIADSKEYLTRITNKE